MHIRSIKRDDLKEWSRMRTALWPKATENHLEEIELFFSGDSVDIVEALVLARESDGLAGFLELNIRSFAEGSRTKGVPYIEAWYIDPDARGHGWGRKLVIAAEGWARERGYRELGSDAEIDNLDGIAAHIALNFREVDRVVCFLKRLV